MYIMCLNYITSTFLHYIKFILLRRLHFKRSFVIKQLSWGNFISYVERREKKYIASD